MQKLSFGPPGTAGIAPRSRGAFDAIVHGFSGTDDQQLKRRVRAMARG